MSVTIEVTEAEYVEMYVGLLAAYDQSFGIQRERLGEILRFKFDCPEIRLQVPALV